MLKFITEDYLKDLYKKDSFMSYKLETDERLTPGGRQYLLDKGIKINSNLPTDSKKNLKEEPIKEVIKDKRLIYKFKALEALFLSSAIEMLNEDLNLAQKVVDLARSIKNIRTCIEEKCKLEIINPKNSFEKSDQLEITDIYIHLKNSKQILNLYFLYCKLEEFKYEITFDYEREDVLENIVQIENILSGIIKEEAGERQSD